MTTKNNDMGYLLLIIIGRIDVIYSGKRRFNIKLWKTFTDCFNCLPIAAIVNLPDLSKFNKKWYWVIDSDSIFLQIDEKIFCCHGGLSPDLQNMEQIRRIMRPTDVPDTGLL